MYIPIPNQVTYQCFTSAGAISLSDYLMHIYLC